MRIALFAVSLIVVGTSVLSAQETVRLIEVFRPDYQYRVSCRVDIAGTLTVPASKNAASQTLKISGASSIKYHERVLSLAQGKAAKTVRLVQKMDFSRKVGEQDQENKLRPDVSLLVIQRLDNVEVPFSPQGPLLLGEIELVRTDVFTPALAGLLPRAPVKTGDEWPADLDAIKELTDLEKVAKGALTCRFEGIDRVNAQLARVGFRGVINGVGEDGPAQHELEGFFNFDLKSNHISYVSLQGVHRPLSAAGLPQGEIKGTFVLTREPAEIAELSDAALARWNLNANDDNTQLLFDTPEARFVYPRHWRVDEANGRQIHLVEKQGSDLLMTLDPIAKQPSAVTFQKEVLSKLTEQKAVLDRVHQLRLLHTNPFHIEHFGVDARFGTQPAVFDYFVVRQNGGGATLSGRYVPAQADARRGEVERMARSLVLNVK